MTRYDSEDFGFDGTIEDIDSYFTMENFEYMFGQCDLTDDDFEELRRCAYTDLTERGL